MYTNEQRELIANLYKKQNKSAKEIQLCFSTWKHYIYDFDKTNVDTAYKVIDECSKEITETKCQNWITHARKYYLNCIQKISFD